MLRKVFIILLITAGACSDTDTVKIGIISSLSGKFADHGVLGRDGVLLAVEEINKNGGMNGKKIIPVIKDDRSLPEEAFRAAQELHKESVRFIIGPFITGSATAILPLINEKHILTIGPTIAGDNLSYIDDYFIKLFPSTKDTAIALGEYASKKQNIRRAGAVCDETNKQFSDSWYSSFRNVMEAAGGRMYEPVMFRSGTKVDYDKIAESVLRNRPEAVLIIAGSLDLAYICQKIRRRDMTVKIFTASWGVTSDLVTNGGNSVNGITYYLPYDVSDKSREYEDFRKRFIARFSVEPGFSSGLYYEAVQLLNSGIKESGSFNPDKVKSRITETGRFIGVQSEYSIDRYGDVHRPFYLYTIRKGGISRISE